MADKIKKTTGTNRKTAVSSKAKRASSAKTRVDELRSTISMKKIAAGTKKPFCVCIS